MNAFLPMTGFFLLIVALSAAFFCWLPRLTRPDLYFALTLPAEFRDSSDGRATLRIFRLQIVIWSLGAWALVAAGGLNASIVLLTAGVGVQILGFFVAYFGARHRVRPSTVEFTAVREAALTARPLHMPGGWTLQAGPFVILGAAAVYLGRRWPDISVRFPVHWGLDGQPNGWATRSLSGVYGPFIFAALMCLLLAGVGYGILHWSRPTRLRGALAQAEEHFYRVVLGVLSGAEYLVALVFVWAALLFLTPGPPNVRLAIALPLMFALAVMLILIRHGLGAAAHAAEAGGEGGRPVGDRTSDSYWKAGLFSANRDDPAVFVEKRFGIGYTLNFGHPVTCAFLAATVLLPIMVGLLANAAGN
jgi:uncharacterized membrane protein